MKCKPIYVEIPINTTIDNVWDASQKPDMHEQWDLRFSSITYLPKEEGEPQSFTYSRTVGPFIKSKDGGKVSAPFIKRMDPELLLYILERINGSPLSVKDGVIGNMNNRRNGVKFLTQYDYDVNFGRAGKIADKFIFRPLIGWATALSFDVLKRWLEKGEAPRSQYIRFFSTYLITVSVRIYMDVSRVNSKNHWNASRRTCDGWKYFFLFR